MSGPDLFFAVLGMRSTSSTKISQSLTTCVGASIPIVQAAIAAKDRSARLAEPRLHAKDIVELHNNAGQELFSAVYSNLQIYQDLVEPNVDETDRVFASNLRKSIYRTVKESQETAQQLYNATKDKRTKPEAIKAMADKLGEYAKYLNNLQLAMIKSVAFHRSSSEELLVANVRQSFIAPTVPAARSRRRCRLCTDPNRAVGEFLDYITA